MNKIIFLIITLLFLVSCDGQKSNIKPTIDRVDKDISVRVIFHETDESLEEAYRQHLNLSQRVPIPEQWGFAHWNEWRDIDGNYMEPDNAQFRCTIHTFTPRRQDDQHVTTLGHELLHCLYGSYHP